MFLINPLGFTYNFAAIQNQSNELFLAYKEMFEVAISQGSNGLWLLLVLYFPILEWFFVRNFSNDSFICFNIFS